MQRRATLAPPRKPRSLRDAEAALYPENVAGIHPLENYLEFALPLLKPPGHILSWMLQERPAAQRGHLGA